MGILSSKKSHSTENHQKGVYRVRARDTAAMKKVWLSVENDLPYYGSIFSTILFRNHPRYAKYFHEDNIPEFVQDARIKKKFSSVCAIVSALFIDYSNKQRQRDHLLGFIAMVHKDMQLTSQDLENFMMDLLEMLIQERPKEMTAVCTVVHMRYFSGLLKRIGYFMEIQREKDWQLLEEEPPDRQHCGWTSSCDSPSIYGRSFDYWIAKKNYWQIRMSVWSSPGKKLSGISSFLGTKRIDDDPHNSKAIKQRSFSIRRGAPVIKNKLHPRSKLNEQLPSSATTSSESSSNDDLGVESNSLQNRTKIWYDRCKKAKRRYRIEGTAPISSKPRKPITENRSRRTIEQPLKSSMKNTEAFQNVAKALQTAKVHIASDEITSLTPMRNRTMIDTARTRERRRERKSRIAALKKNYVLQQKTASNAEDDDDDS